MEQESDRQEGREHRGRRGRDAIRVRSRWPQGGERAVGGAGPSDHRCARSGRSAAVPSVLRLGSHIPVGGVRFRWDGGRADLASPGLDALGIRALVPQPGPPAGVHGAAGGDRAGRGQAGGGRRPMKVTGAKALFKALEGEGVDVVFGIPGGPILPAYDPLLDSSIRHILNRHEQGAGHAAEGYAWATGKEGVCMATSGPGGCNLVTALADAKMDSVPIVAIT